ncbi:MAG: hypothetical protein ACI8XM_000842 [Haloarculaceae archaeon]|jgi:hypothetical protein
MDGIRVVVLGTLLALGAIAATLEMGGSPVMAVSAAAGSALPATIIYAVILADRQPQATRGSTEGGPGTN